MVFVRCRVFLAPFILLFGLKSFAIFVDEGMDEREKILTSQNSDSIKDGFNRGLWPGAEKGFEVFLLTGYELFDVIDFFRNPSLTFTLFLDYFRAANFSQDVRIKILQMIDLCDNSSTMTARLKAILDTDTAHPDNILELLIQDDEHEALFLQFEIESADDVIIKYLFKAIPELDKNMAVPSKLREVLSQDLKKPYFFSSLEGSIASRIEVIEQSMNFLFDYHQQLLHGDTFVSVPQLVTAFKTVNFEREFIESSLHLLGIVERPDQFLVALYKADERIRPQIIESLRETAKGEIIEHVVFDLKRQSWCLDGETIIANWRMFQPSTLN